MKQIRNIILSTVSVGLAMSLAGCTNSYEDYNQDPYGVSKKETERDAYSLGAAMINLQSWVVPTDVNTNQFTECLCGGSYGGYLSDSNAGFAGKNFAQYSPENGWSRGFFWELLPKLFFFFY